MRPGQQNKRGRGRGSNNNNNGGGGGGNNFNRKGSNPLTRTYDSSGPDVKVRGTAQHIAEKYTALARDAQSAGDRVIAENYLQHAEHYNRIIAAAQAQMQERFQHQDRQDYNGQDERDGDDIDGNEDDDGIQPMVDQQPREQSNREQGNRNREDRGNRDNRGNREDRGNRDSNRGNREQRHQDQVAEQPNGDMAAHDAGTQAAPVVSETDDQPRLERQPRPRREPRERRAAQADAVIDGSGPQPVIEGVPAEVAAEEAEAQASPRRRAAARPRRQPRKSAEGGDATDGQPEMADVAGE